MSRGLAFFLACVAVCTALSFGVGAGELEYCATLDAAIEAAEKNHQLVMIVVVAPIMDKEGKDLCKLLREETLPEEQIAKLIRRHCAPFLFDIAAVREGKQAVPPVVQACFKPGEQITVPQAIFLDAKCKLVARILGYAPPAGYIGQIRQVLEKVSALVPEKDRREAERALERGKKAVEEKDFPTAIEALKTAVASGAPGDGTDAAQKMLDDIEAKAAEAQQKAADLEDQKKLGSAIRAYRECARTFKGTDAGTKAGERLVEIQKDPDVRKRLDAYMAGDLLAKARRDVEQKRFGPALEALDAILARYADADEAAEAKKLRAAINADPDAASRLRDGRARAEAESWLSLGDSFRRNKMHDKAIAEYQKVVDKFPDTTFARTARERIAEAKKERPQ